MSQKSYAIVGGGINGLAVARELQLNHPDAKVAVFEKESSVAMHQTSHNSGVVHAGLYYDKGSLKARLCRRGVDLIKAFCLEKNLPYDECGKIVVALNSLEEERLKALYQKSLDNEVPDVRMLYGDEIREVEPNCTGIAALYSPHTAIVDYRLIAETIASEIVEKGGVIYLDSKINRLIDKNGKISLELTNGKLHDDQFDYAITCAGLQSDRLANKSGDKKTPKIVPFFGQYFVLEEKYRDSIKGLIYPVPDPKYPFLGVHFTKRIDGEMLIGPNAFLSKARENYDGRGFNLKDVFDYVRYSGFWYFAFKNIPAAIREIKTVLSRKQFVAEAVKYVPLLKNVKVAPATRGIRAQAMESNGRLVDDFVIRKEGDIIHIRNAPSPGATSSLAIAEYIVQEIIENKK